MAGPGSSPRLPAWLPPETSRTPVSGPQPLSARAPSASLSSRSGPMPASEARLASSPRSCSRDGKRRAARRRRPRRCGPGPTPSRRRGSRARRRRGRRGGWPSRGSRASTGGRGCRPRPSEQSASAVSDPGRQSTTWTKAVTGRPASVLPDGALLRHRRRRRPSGSGASRPGSAARAVLEGERRHVLAGQVADLGAVGGDQRRLVVAGAGDRHRAEDARGDRLRQRGPRDPQTEDGERRARAARRAPAGRPTQPSTGRDPTGYPPPHMAAKRSEGGTLPRAACP